MKKARLQIFVLFASILSFFLIPKAVRAETCEIYENKTFYCNPVEFNENEKYFRDANEMCDAGHCEKQCWWDDFTGINRECWPPGITSHPPKDCPPGRGLKCCKDLDTDFPACVEPQPDLTCQTGYTLTCCYETIAGWTCDAPPGKYCPKGYEYDKETELCLPTTKPEMRDPCYDPSTNTVNLECMACLGGPKWSYPNRPNIGKKAWTALGCIPFDPAELIKILIRISFGIGGGIAFLFMVIGAFKVLTSQGNPELLNEGKSMITSSIAGLLLIIFSVIILKIIGYDILQLPGFEQKQSFKRSNNFSFYFKQDYQYTQ